MWISNRILDFFKISQESFAGLREEVAALKAENTALRSELTAIRINSDWLRLGWNNLQAENKALLDRMYGVKTPVPELVSRRDVTTAETFTSLQDLFTDMGDDKAQEHGFPVYGSKQN